METPSNRKIIAREILDAQADARRLVAEAEQQARSILADTADRAQAIAERAYQEGFAKGLAETSRITIDAHRYAAELERSAEPRLLELVFGIARRILRSEWITNPESAVAMIKDALTQLRDQRSIVVRVHPDDARRFRDQFAAFLPVLAYPSEFQVIEDATIVCGGCIVTSPAGSIDARLERQLEVFREHFFPGAGQASLSTGRRHNQ